MDEIKTESAVCVLCYEQTNDRVKNFTEATLDKSRTILQIRKKFNLKFSEVLLPVELSDYVGYHARCYKNFIAVMRKYREKQECVSPDLLTLSPENVFPENRVQMITHPVGDATIQQSKNKLSTSNLTTYNKKSCVFCGKHFKRVKGRFQAVQSISTKDLKQILNKFGKDNEYYGKVSRMSNALVCYHRSCRTNALYKLQGKKKMAAEDLVQVYSYKHLENIGSALKTLYTEEHLSDVTILCKEGSLKAHKLILAANSPYFCKIFKENRKDSPLIILQGTTITQLKNLMDLLYKGNVDVCHSDLAAFSSLVNEFEIKGVIFGQRSSDNVRIELNQTSQSPENIHNRDTRYRGQKRVAVDYADDGESEAAASSISINVSEHGVTQSSNQDNFMPIKREVSPANSFDSSMCSFTEVGVSERKSVSSSPSVPKLNAWARKQRKFKCELCPSSFKRSSHLSRHQLVHTGERPYSCSQCEKAFSRHDKLKHHVRKTHEFIPDSMYERIDTESVNEDSESESSRKNYSSPLQSSNDQPQSSIPEYVENFSPNQFHRENSPLFTISHISSILEDSFVVPPKKARGRPRKYPPPPPQLVKRGRGRPRINQVIFPALRPGPQNYDMSTLPYGDLNYLTSQPKERLPVDEESTMLEPLVEINMDQNDNSRDGDSMHGKRPHSNRSMEDADVEEVPVDPLVKTTCVNIKKEPCEASQDCSNIDISEIETKIGLIGECTISVAN